MHERVRLQRNGVTAREATHVVEIPVLGIMTRFVSNSNRVLVAVEDAFGDWRSLDSSYVRSDSMRTVHLVVPAGVECNESAHGGVAHIVNDDGRLTIHSRCARQCRGILS